MLSVSEARRVLLDGVSALEAAEVAPSEASGRTLAASVVADRDAPPTDRSSMDGFAVRAADAATPGRTLRVIGEVRAGASADGLLLGPGEAARIFTGSVIPAGADAVVMVELTEENRAEGRVRIAEQVERGQNIRPRGEDRRAGECVLAAGTTIRAAEIAALAAVGCLRVPVVRPPRVAVLATGDELVAIDGTPAPHQIRNSNAPMLAALLGGEGAVARVHGTVADDLDALAAAVGAVSDADLVVLSGGVSVGDYDLVEEAARRRGYEVLFHNVAMRPGKPILAARRGRRLLFGLPGNPLSAFAGFHVLVAPVVRRLMGDPHLRPRRLRATLAEAVRQRPGREGYVLARLAWPEGVPVVAQVRSASSGDVLSLARANAFIVVPAEAASLEAGALVDVMAWDARAPGGA